MAGSRSPGDQLRRQTQQLLLSSASSGSQRVKDPDTVSPKTRAHLMSEASPDKLGTDLKGTAIRRGSSSNLRQSTSSVDSSFHSTIPAAKGDPLEKHISLADQYLDTMIMDDNWRSRCLETIRLNQRKQRSYKRANVKSTTRHNRPSKASIQQRRGVPFTRKVAKHLGSSPPTPPLSSARSDSGFISSSPSPAPPTYLRLRSTRNCPTTTSSPATIPIDVSPSMIGRTCLSCGSANTTCWRRTLGGIICNSCGLRLTIPHDISDDGRYKKCGIICADVGCRYIPTRSEIREMKHQGGRAGQCYACKSDIVTRENEV